MKLYGGSSAKHAGSKKSTSARKGITASIALILIICLAIGGTVAFIVTHTEEIKNIFTPSEVIIETNEKFDGTVKKNVNVKNTGNTDAYIRVKLVTYMTDESGSPISGNASIPHFDPGSDWFYCVNDDTYYYSKPVAPNSKTSDLIGNNGITLENGQVVEVLAEGIQSVPDNAVEEAWSAVKVADGVLQVKGA